MLIRSLVADRELVCELDARYRHAGVAHQAVIATFFPFTGEQISAVKVYREGSANPLSGLALPQSSSQPRSSARMNGGVTPAP
jgi:hypothetical protein